MHYALIRQYDIMDGFFTLRQAPHRVKVVGFQHPSGIGTVVSSRLYEKQNIYPHSKGYLDIDDEDVVSSRQN